MCCLNATENCISSFSYDQNMGGNVIGPLHKIMNFVSILRNELFATTNQLSANQLSVPVKKWKTTKITI